ncbi:DUF6992 family protein [Meiothermus rufus]|uniref:DUF6992 family protein n=1 Tax=Meiothermus rufus TaxID=604332 RepID=UPI000407A96F|nr:hypothetical protein [Meiothermus rufus]
MSRSFAVALLVCLGLGLAQAPFSLGVANTEAPSPRPTWEGLLFGPAPEGYRGLATSARLLAWSVPWALVGSSLGLLSENPAQRSFWLTHAIWASVNSGIALVGLLGPEPEKAYLRDLLYLNAGLDLLYIAGGIYLALRPEARSQGAGWAIVLQGTWLLLFDLFNALALEGG